jgi:hypothetical protein
MNRKVNLRDRLSYYNSVIFRVLPNIKYHFKHLERVLKSKKVKSYFKSVRKIQPYPGVYNYLKAHGFDMSLADDIMSYRDRTQEVFLQNIKDLHLLISNVKSHRGLCGINKHHLRFIESEVFAKLFPSHRTAIIPDLGSVYDAIRFSTSSGLPQPWLRKRDIKFQLLDLLKLLYSKELKIEDILGWPSATFLRNQIRTSGLKMRVIHAVNASQLVIESFYYKVFSSLICSDSCITMGLTQIQISERVSQYKDLYTYSVDYSKWDQTRQPILSIISFDILCQLCGFSEYLLKICNFLRNYYLTLPMYHPSVELTRRYIGTVSGSGFTSLDNSICNFLVVAITIYDYCRHENLNPYKFYYKLNTSGDDLLLGFKEPINFELFSRLANNRFGCVMKLEIEVQAPGKNCCFYLGSKWIDGKPFREQKTLVASVIFGSGNFPRMTTEKLVASRFIEVFGNSADCGSYFKRFRGKLDIKKRLFFFSELYTPFRTGNEERIKLIKPISGQAISSRGFWYTRTEHHDDLNDTWSTR